MNENNLWNVFIQTGNPKDYINYKKQSNQSQQFKQAIASSQRQQIALCEKQTNQKAQPDKEI